MLKLEDYPELDHWTTMREASLDDAKGVYLTDSCSGEIDYTKIQVIDFDDVKDAYCGSLQIKGDYPCSNDALFCSVQDRLVFVEFKNGAVSKFNLSRKMYDSILILTDVLQKGISYTRENVEYVLVCREKILDKEEAQDREEIKNHISQKALSEGYELISFGLERFKGYLLKDVHTYTPSQFEAYMKDHMQPTA